jgi:hypothetical protein
MNKFLTNSMTALIFVPALLLANGASAKQAGDLQNQAVALQYVSCLAKAADRNDDGVSDPQMIAAKILPICAEEFSREQVAFSDGLSQGEQQTYRQMMMQQQPQLAVSVVTSEREWAVNAHKPSGQRLAQSN